MVTTQSTDPDESVRITALALIAREVQATYEAGMAHKPCIGVEAVPVTVVGAAYMAGIRHAEFSVPHILSGCREYRHAVTDRTPPDRLASAMCVLAGQPYPAGGGGLHRLSEDNREWVA